MSTTAIKEQADSYLIRNDQEWARIFIQQGTRESGSTWGYISVISGYGNFGHCFSCCSGEFRRFLCGLNRDYLMGKFFGSALQVFDNDKAATDLKKFLIDRRRHGGVEKEEAREMWNHLVDIHTNGYQSQETFYTALCERWDKRFWDWEAWSIGGTVMNPQALGFWETIWPVFVAALRAEIKSETQEAA